MHRRARIVFAIPLCVGAGLAAWFLTRPEPPIGPDGLRYDPIEDDPNVRPLVRAAEREAEQEVPVDNGKAWSRRFDKVKKRVLKEKYGIDWRTRAEMNLDATFD